MTACPYPGLCATRPSVCHCGRGSRERERACTWRLALVLAEVAFGHRSIGGHKGDNLGTRKGVG